MIIFGKTDTGVVRDNNQDSFRTVTKNGLSLCVVCDGMGGAAGGSTASNTACDAFVEKAFELIEENTENTEYADILTRAVKYANHKVYSLAKSDKELSGMGTTLCAILADGKKIYAVSVGDSRIYMFDGGEVFQISHDHSYVQVLVDSGAITKEEGRTHPNKNIITRAIGTNEDVECDSYLMNFDADGFLLCSDGLTNYVTENLLKEFFYTHSGDPSLLADSLINYANNAGGSDNITVLLLISDKN